MDKNAQEKQNFEGRLSARSEIPRTPLIRGARNYFPDGVKMKKIELSGSFRNPSSSRRFTGLKDASPRNSTPLHVVWPPTTAHPRARDWNHSLPCFKYPENQQVEVCGLSGLPATACADTCRQTSLGPIVPTHPIGLKEITYAQTADTMGRSVARCINVRGNRLKSQEVESEASSSSLSSFYSDRSEASTKSGDSFPRHHQCDSTKDALEADLLANPEVPSSSGSQNAVNLECKANERKQDSRLGFQVHVRLRPLDEQEFGSKGFIFCNH